VKSRSAGWSVVVCAYTFDRLALTSACIGAVLAQPERPEVIVVTDHNDELGEELRRRFPGVTVIPNSHRRGLGGARNSGTEAASADFVAFVDDDAEPSLGWLAGLGAAFQDPLVVGVGGDAEPVWEGSPPAWFPDEYLWVVGCSYRGMARDGSVRNPLGCNMAFRRQVLIAVGGFDQMLGRIGNVPFGLEETELCVRLIKADPSARIVIVPDAGVRHHVPPGRQRPAYFLQRCFYEGVGKAQLSDLASSAALSSERSYALRVLPAAVIREVAGSIRLDRPLTRLSTAAAIIGGLGAAAAGYACGRLRSARLTRGSRARAEQAIVPPDD
jgi:glucosyl-dolichyl phosphate glucuronosyltransferase